MVRAIVPPTALGPTDVHNEPFPGHPLTPRAQTTRSRVMPSTTLDPEIQNPGVVPIPTAVGDGTRHYGKQCLFRNECPNY